MDQSSKDRVALNEATFRSVNENIRSGEDSGEGSFICECGRLGCNQVIRLSLADYEAVRADSRHFAVVPGHELLETERVVATHPGHLVVEKSEDVAGIADRTDPRRGPIDGI